jgi:hypothetical protein
MAPVSKQEVQGLLDNTRKQIVEKVATRHDVQTLGEASRDRVMNYTRDLLQVYQQNMLRRLEFYHIQHTRRVATLENRMMSLEQELKAMRQAMERIADSASSPQRIYMPLQNDSDKQPYTQYVYKPTG